VCINMSQTRVKDSSKRLKAFLQEKGFDLTCGQALVSARLLGFKSWDSYWHQHDLPLSPLDRDLSEEEFVERDRLQMKVCEAEGYGEIAEEFLDRVDPTGSWHQTFPEGEGFRLLRRQTRTRMALQAPLLDRALKIVATGEKEDPDVEA
jgi:hypothetical protein